MRVLRPNSTSITVVAVALAFVLLGNGCSGARLAGWYLTRRIDKYLDLNSEQKTWVRARVDHHVAVARRELSDDIIPLLRRVREVVARRPTESDLVALQREVDALVESVVERIVPDAAALFASLDDAQIARFQDQMREGLGKAYEDLRLPPEERRERADEKALEAVEKWTGDLTPTQARRVLQIVRAVEDDRPATYRAHVQRLNTFADLLRGDASALDVGRALRDLWATRYEALAPPRSMEARRAEQRRALLALDGLITMDQRRHLIGEIDGVIRKLKRFAAD